MAVAARRKPADVPPGPPFPIGELTSAAWRERVLARITELEALKSWINEIQPRPDAGWGAIAAAVDRHLAAAYEAASPRQQSRRGRMRTVRSGSAVERATSHLDAARAQLLQLAPLPYVRGQLPSLVAYVRSHLPKQDIRLQRVEQIAKQASREDLTETQRAEVVASLRDAGAEARNEVARVRSFRNVLLVVAGLLTVAAVVLAILGSERPSLVHLCFTPDNSVVCPTHQGEIKSGTDAAAAQTPPTDSEISAAIDKVASRWDLFVVELVGAIGAAIAAAAAIRRVKGTSTPYSLPVAVALLKLPTGALTAVLGLLLMRGEFVPGLTNLDTPGQILAWAVVFGSAQQLFLGLVDERAQDVLNDVAGKGANGAAAPQAS